MGGKRGGTFSAAGAPASPEMVNTVPAGRSLGDLKVT